jgi:hypothetical protein
LNEDAILLNGIYINENNKMEEFKRWGRYIGDIHGPKKNL